MKTNFLLPLFFILVNTASIFSQNLTDPDINFKTCLLENSDINTNGDSEIQETEASSY